MDVHEQYLYYSLPDNDSDVIMYHSGFCSTTPNYSYGFDTRNYYLIHYVTKGKGVYSVGNKRYHLSQYDGFLITPDSEIVHTADKYDPWDLCWIGFSGKSVKSLLANCGLDEENLIFHYDKDDLLESYIMEINNISRTTLNMNKILGYFYFLIGVLEENCQKNSPKNKPLKFSKFQYAVMHIKRNINNIITVAELSNVLQVDESQVYRIFIKESGVTPSQYINNVKMDKAGQLLSKTELTIKEISEWLGYEYQSHFSKRFKTYYSVSPSTFRKNTTAK